MKAVGYLGDAQLRGLQQERGLHQEHLIDIVDNGAAGDLTDDAGEIDGGDVKFRGIERDVMVPGEVAGQQADEADEDFLDALGRLAVNDGELLGVLQVEQEDGVEHPQDLALVDVVGVQVADDFAHLRGQVPCGVRGQRLLRLVQLHDGQVGQVYEVVDGRFLSLFSPNRTYNSKTFRTFAAEKRLTNTERDRRMTTMTVQIPTGQVGWFEQMLRSMGWAFRKEDTSASASEKPRVFEAEVDELLSMFNTDQISQEEVDRECELVREELYDARKTR